MCYGDVRHEHFVQPKDMELMVELVNDAVQSLGPTHPVAYVHMPVPNDRVDEGYFEPLRELKLGGGSYFLGAVHAGIWRVRRRGSQQRRRCMRRRLG